jgi:hypothetical protein
MMPDFYALTPVKSGVTENVTLAVATQKDAMALRFTGAIEIPAAGQYTFYTTSDDGSQLWVDNTLVVNNDGLHAKQERAGTITLTQGFHPITIAYFEQGGGEILEARWEGPGIAKQLIPNTALWYAPTGGTAIRVTDALMPERFRMFARGDLATGHAVVVFFTIPAQGREAYSHVSLQLYDMQGRLVRTLVNGALLSGCHRVRIDDAAFGKISAGHYVCRLTADGHTETVAVPILR